MSLQVELAKLRTIVEQTLGPDGSISKTLGEIKVDLKDGAKVMDDHALRIDRLEQTQNRRTKLGWTLVTAWVGVVVAWLWDRVHR